LAAACKALGCNCLPLCTLSTTPHTHNAVPHAPHTQCQYMQEKSDVEPELPPRLREGWGPHTPSSPSVPPVIPTVLTTTTHALKSMHTFSPLLRSMSYIHRRSQMLSPSSPRVCVRVGVSCSPWLLSWLSCRVSTACPLHQRTTAEKCCTLDSCRCVGLNNLCGKEGEMYI
jgi:hypothetical protein